MDSDEFGPERFRVLGIVELIIWLLYCVCVGLE